MKRIGAEKLKSMARWFLLISVLAGSFLSSGEGIQLLPFPVTERTGEGAPSDFHGGPKRTYAFSVHNLSNSLLLKSSFHNKVKKEATVHNAVSAGRYEIIDFVYPAPHTHRKQISLGTQPVLSIPSDRAPPALSLAVA